MIAKVAKHYWEFLILLFVMGKHLRDQIDMKDYERVIKTLKKGDISFHANGTRKSQIFYMYQKISPDSQADFLMTFMLDSIKNIFTGFYDSSEESRWDNIVRIVGENEMKELAFKGMLKKEDQHVVFHDMLKGMAEKEAKKYWILKAQEWERACNEHKTEGILGIHLDYGANAHIQASDLDAASESLRMLSLCTTPVNGKCKETFRELRHLCMIASGSKGFPFQNLKDFAKLRMVEITDFELMNKEILPSLCLLSLNTLIINGGKGIDYLPKEFQNLKSLQKLELRGFDSLVTLPPFIFPNLQILRLGCKLIKNLPVGFGRLFSLKILLLEGCENVDSFPEDLRGLANMEQFSIHKCMKIGSLPSGFYQWTSLKMLYIDGCPSLRFTEDFANLVALEICTFRDTGSDDWPSRCWGQLSALRDLKLNFNAKTLPGNISRLAALEELMIFNETLEALPHDFGSFQMLKALSLIDSLHLRSLPDSFARLPKLEMLKLSKLGIEALPDDFSLLTSLRDLKIIDCGSLTSLPEGFGKLTALENLELIKNEKLNGLAQCFGELTNLEKLTLVACPCLPEDALDEALKLPKLEKLGLLIDNPSDRFVKRWNFFNPEDYPNVKVFKDNWFWYWI